MLPASEEYVDSYFGLLSLLKHGYSPKADNTQSKNPYVAICRLRDTVSEKASGRLSLQVAIAQMDPCSYKAVFIDSSLHDHQDYQLFLQRTKMLYFTIPSTNCLCKVLGNDIKIIKLSRQILVY